MKPSQFVGQVRYRLKKYLPHKANGNYSKTFPGMVKDKPTISFLPPAPGNNARVKLEQGKFNFLNDPAHIGWPPDWMAESQKKLWQYNLHYFEWLWCLEYRKGVEAALDWITNHGPGKGQVGWEPYPLCLRMQNWASFFFDLHRDKTLADISFRDLLWISMAQQMNHLQDNLEIHLGGNHLLENLVTLVWIGSLFDGPDAEEWRKAGLFMLEQELQEQFLPDGMHFERSPMYHCRTLFLLLNLYALGDKAICSLVRPYLERAVDALQKLIHPDGHIALLNDSAFGIYNDPDVLFQYYAKVAETRSDLSPLPSRPSGCWTLPDAGYCGWSDEQGTYIVCDVGAIGPDYIPGHAHADMLSFELSFAGNRVIVDSGVHDYERSEMRQWVRSTGAHNTVLVEDQDQCEMWAAFRVGHRGRPRDVSWQASDKGFVLEAWHDGYRRIKGNPRHRRKFTWSAEEYLFCVEDTIESSDPVKALIKYQFHPECALAIKDKEVSVRCPEGILLVSSNGCKQPVLDQAWYCPEFGVRQPNSALAMQFMKEQMVASTSLKFSV